MRPTSRCLLPSSRFLGNFTDHFDGLATIRPSGFAPDRPRDETAGVCYVKAMAATWIPPSRLPESPRFREPRNSRCTHAGDDVTKSDHESSASRIGNQNRMYAA